MHAADAFRLSLADVGEAFGLKVRTVIADGTQPVGRGIGPALEAHDVLAVLTTRAGRAAPICAIMRLRSRRPFSNSAARRRTAKAGAWRARRWIAAGLGPNSSASARHRAACARRRSRGTARTSARHASGRVERIDNRRLARVAKLAGAPEDKTAGLELHVRVDDRVDAPVSRFTPSMRIRRAR